MLVLVMQEWPTSVHGGYGDTHIVAHMLVSHIKRLYSKMHTLTLNVTHNRLFPRDAIKDGGIESMSSNLLTSGLTGGLPYLIY